MSRKWFSKGGEAHRGWYKGYWCDSSWELAFIIWHLDHNIEITRNTKVFPYPWRRGVKYYQPDFIIGGTYYEVKGVLDYRSKRKAESFPYPLVIVGGREMKPFLEYARLMYGDDFAVRLLEPPSSTSRILARKDDR